MRFFLLRLLLLAVFVLSAGSRLFAQAPAWQWATSPGAGDGTSTTVDAAGNVYVTGSFSGTATFGATTLISAGDDDIFVAKLTSSGAYQWAVRAGGTRDDIAHGVAVDGSGHVVITGDFRDTATFGPTTLISPSRLHRSAGGGCRGPAFTSLRRSVNLFVAKLSPAGAWLWATSAVGEGDAHSTAVAVDSRDHLLITGDLRGKARFGATTLVGGADIFVAKLTPTGRWLWATQAAGGADDRSTDVAVDRDDHVVVTGAFGGTVRFGATALTQEVSYGADIFVAKLTPTGDWLWATQAVGRSNGGEASNGVAVDGRNRIVITGRFRQSITFGTINLINPGGDGLFAAQLTPTGDWQWATNADVVGEGGGGYAVAVDPHDHILLTGCFRGSACFGPTTLTSVGWLDMVVAKLTPAGNWLWATSAGGQNRVVSHGVATDRNGHVYVTGWLDGPAVVGATPLIGRPASSFLARLNSTTGLPDTADHSAFTLTPNPARTTVQLTGAPGPTATLLDALGREVGTTPLTQGAATLDVRALPAGLYLLRAGAATRRLVVE